MLRLDQIKLIQFRNYIQNHFQFNERIVGICGKNGSGKTNLLDAIYYLSFSKSYFSRVDASNVHHGLQGLRLEGYYQLQQKQEQLVFVLRENNKKELMLNEEAYQRFSDHLGKFPCVMIAPDDIGLITGGSEERRKLVDTILSQLNKDYLLALIDYQKILQQRNSLLKQMAETGHSDHMLMEILDEQLASKGNLLYAWRVSFLQDYLKMVSEIYIKIAGVSDGIELHYESQLAKGNMKSVLEAARTKDSILQRTTAGIHRDDLVFKMQEQPFKNEASQGQRKSLLFALKLAEWQVLQKQKGFTPILLLDDVFEKLDERRMYQLLHWVCTESDGQVFITDTHADRLKENLNNTKTAFQLIEL